MTSRQPLQSTSNLPPVKQSVPGHGGGGILAKKPDPVSAGVRAAGPVRVPGFTKPTSVARPISASKPDPGTKPGLGGTMAGSGAKPLHLPGSGSKPGPAFGSGSKPHPTGSASSSGSKPGMGSVTASGTQPQPTKPQQAVAGSLHKPHPASSSGTKPAPAAASKAQPGSDSKPTMSEPLSGGLGGGLGKGDKQHRWKLEDFDIGRPLGKVNMDTYIVMSDESSSVIFPPIYNLKRMSVVLSFVTQGKFGNVYLAREKASKYIVALKVLFKSQLQKAQVEHQLR